MHSLPHANRPSGLCPACAAAGAAVLPDSHERGLWQGGSTC
jgi:hypothetical protein